MNYKTLNVAVIASHYQRLKLYDADIRRAIRTAITNGCGMYAVCFVSSDLSNGQKVRISWREDQILLINPDRIESFRAELKEMENAECYFMKDFYSYYMGA